MKIYAPCCFHWRAKKIILLHFSIVKMGYKSGLLDEVTLCKIMHAAPQKWSSPMTGNLLLQCVCMTNSIQ